MIPVLIDTNCLRKLVNGQQTDRNLVIFHDWMESKHIQILAPDALKAEWHRKHKNEAADRAQKAQNNLRKQIKHNSLVGVEEHLPEIPDDDKRILLQVEMVDRIVESSPKISNYPDVLQMIEDMHTNQSAPFFDTNSNQDNWKDAKIIFIALKWVEEAGYKELVFISENTRQFESRDEKGVIHPDIQKKFPNIAIKYATTTNDATSHLLGRGLLNKMNLRIRHNIPRNVIAVSKEKHILDQLHTYLEIRFKEWSFLPVKFFLNQYPFKLDHRYYHSSIPLSIYTDNDTLFEFFKGITKIDDKNYHSEVDITTIEDGNEKLEMVFKTFRQNHLLKLDNGKGEEHVLSNIAESRYCDCYLCKWKGMDFNYLSTLQPEDIDDYKQLMQKGFVAYKLYQFEKAIRIFIMAMEKAKEKDLPVIKFLCQYNITNIVGVIQNNLSAKAADQIISQIPEFDIEETIRLLPSDSRVIAEWIYSEQFIDEHGLNVFRHGDKIKKIYDHKSILYTNDLYHLYADFTNLVEFLTKNCITYESVVINLIYESFLNTLLTSLNTTSAHLPKVSFLGDSDLVNAIFYGEQNALKALFKSHDYKKILYKPNSKILFHEYFFRITEQISTFENSFQKDNSETASWFNIRLNGYLQNALILATYTELPKDAIEKIADILLEFIPRNIATNRSLNFPRDIGVFIRRQIDLIDRKRLFLFLDLAITSKELFFDGLAGTIASLIKWKNIGCAYSQETLDRLNGVLKRSINEGDNNSFSQSINCLMLDTRGEVVDESRKLAIAELKKHFFAQMYYLATVFDFMEDENLKQRYVETVYQVIRSQTISADLVFGIQGASPLVDSFFNWKLKFDHPIPDDIEELLKNRCIYYKWLLDLENFNYIEFDTVWLSHYLTKYYISYFRSSKALKLHLRKILESNSTREMEELFLRIYALDDTER